MMDNTTYFSTDVDFGLRQLEDLLRHGDISGAERLIASLQDQIPEDSEHYAELSRLSRDLVALRTRHADRLVDTARGAVKATPLNQAEAEAALSDLELFQRNHPALDGLRSRLTERVRTQRSQSKEAEIEEEYHRLLQQAKEAEEAELRGAVLIGYYENVLNFITTQEANHKHLLRLKMLKQQALTLYNDARDRHHVAITRQGGGTYRDLLDQLERNPDREFMIAKDTTGLEGVLDSQKAAEKADLLLGRDAIPIVRVQAREWARGKAVEYRDEARRQLDEQHAPLAAENTLLKALDLFMLDEEEIGKVRNDLQTRVEPAKKQREAAQHKLMDAQQLGDAAARWRAWKEAYDTDPYTPDMDEVRNDLLSSVIRYLESRLAEASRALTEADRPDWYTAKQSAGEVIDISQQDGAFTEFHTRAREILAEAEGWQRLESDIKAAISEAETARREDPKAALDGLQTRKVGWGPRSDRFRELTTFLVVLQALVESNTLLARLETAVKASDLKTTENALAECKAVLAVPDTPDQALPRRADLEAMQRRLELHLDFVQARALLEKQDRSPGDENTGLQKLAAVIAGNADDEKAAQFLVESVTLDQTTRAKARTALATATRERDAGHLQRAYTVLRPYKAFPEVAELFEQVVSQWEQQLLTQITSVLRQSRVEQPQRDQLKAWIGWLKELGSEQANALVPKVNAFCAAQNARDLADQKAPDWAEVVKAWEEAVRHDPSHLSYLEERRQAEKNQVMVSATDPGAKEYIDAVEELAQKYPSDVEVKLWWIDALLASVSSRLERGSTELDTIEEEAQQARKLVAQTAQMVAVQSAAPAVKRQVERREKVVAEAQDIVRRCGDVVLQLKADKLVDAWKRAKGQADELVKAYSNKPFLLFWRDRVFEAALNDAQSRLKEAQTKGGDVWERMGPASHVLLLDSDNASARQTLQEVYGEILKLETRHGEIAQDLVGTGYSEKAEAILGAQLGEAVTIGRHLSLAEQVVTNFGGLFKDDIQNLRDQVNRLKAQNSALIATLRSVKSHAETANLALNQAKADSDGSSWHSYREQRRKIGEMGYAFHLTIVDLDKRAEQVRNKQQHLIDLRQKIEKAVAQGDSGLALQLAEQMTGMSSDDPVRSSNAGFNPNQTNDPQADPNDEYGEQARLKVVDPYSKKTMVGLRRVVNQLLLQEEQIAKLTAWLPSIPFSDGSDHGAGKPKLQIQQPILSWAAEKDQFLQLLNYGDFDGARRLLTYLIEGNIESSNASENDSARQGGAPAALTLLAARAKLSTPPYSKQQLLSEYAERLWEHGRTLLQAIEADLRTVSNSRAVIDQREIAWNDAYARFTSAVDVVKNMQGNAFNRWLNRKEIREQKIAARAHYLECRNVCESHPDLDGWEESGLIG